MFKWNVWMLEWGDTGAGQEEMMAPILLERWSHTKFMPVEFDQKDVWHVTWRYDVHDDDDDPTQEWNDGRMCKDSVVQEKYSTTPGVGIIE